MAFTDIDKSSEYFNTVLYTGDGTTSNAITGVGFQPDLVWLKNRSTIAGHHLSDVVRGKSGTNYLTLSTDTTAAEAAQGDNDGVNTLGSDGFTVGYTNSTAWNNSGNNYVAWNFKANGAGVSNTDGTISSTVSASTTSGFSIVSFDLTGQTGVNTVGHGLGTAPKVVITKRRSGGAGAWTSYFGAIGNNYLVLNSTAASATNADFMNNTAPTSSVFTVGDPTWWAQSPFIAYCFAEKKGFSKFGSYTGNGSADGTFVYTGFKPAFVIIKPSSYANSWLILDNKRNTFNPVKTRLEADGSGADSSTLDYADFLSNGFKIRTSNGHPNTSGGTLIYMAFASQPFVTSSGICATAR